QTHTGPSPAFRERRHRGLARRLVALRWAARSGCSMKPFGRGRRTQRAALRQPDTATATIPRGARDSNSPRTAKRQAVGDLFMGSFTIAFVPATMTINCQPREHKQFARIAGGGNAFLLGGIRLKVDRQRAARAVLDHEMIANVAIGAAVPNVHADVIHSHL